MFTCGISIYDTVIIMTVVLVSPFIYLSILCIFFEIHIFIHLYKITVMKIAYNS